MASMIAEKWTARPACPGSPTVRSALINGTRLLEQIGIDTARLDAEVLLRHVLDFDRGQLYLNLDSQLDIGAERRFGDLLARRLRREPVAYITARQEFWSMDFRVTPDVLIPRPETERLVEIAVQMGHAFPSDVPLRILDLGTGSGAIAVSLSKELPRARLWATDLSVPALRIARQNAACHGVGEQIQFAGSNLFDSIGTTSKFHMIVSNPPYVRRGELEMLAPEVSQWEPRTALDGGVDGLDCYRQIIAQACLHLLPGGALLVEIGADLGQQVAQLLKNPGAYKPAVIYQDYAGSDRVVVAQRLATGTVSDRRHA